MYFTTFALVFFRKTLPSFQNLPQEHGSLVPAVFLDSVYKVIIDDC